VFAPHRLRLARAARSGWRVCSIAVAATAMVGLVVVFNAPSLARFFLGFDQVAVQRTTEFTYMMGGMRCGLAAMFAFLHLPVVWVYSSIIGDYLLKGSRLIWRFKSRRWRHTLTENIVTV
jgi:Na+-driven multidrug efflux pump